VEKLPLILVVADNQYAYSTPTERQFACQDLSQKAVGYGVRSYSIDGTDLSVCLETAGEAFARARAGEGPQLIVAKLLRLCGHGEHDDSNYIDPELKSSPLGRDCLKVAEEILLRQKWADNSQVAVWRSETIREIEEAVAQVQREPAPDPFAEQWTAIASEHLNEIHEE
jgi:TPP-dependent pyruvate/acetoin dehydrogenase alpha subunit